MKIRNKIFIVFIALTFIISLSGFSTLAYFSDKAQTSGNSITTSSNYPKPTIRIYASAGPICTGTFSSSPSYQSPSYTDWLNNAATYISTDITRTPTGTPTSVGYIFTEFKNILNNGSTSINNDMASPIFSNWKGYTMNSGSEMGTIVHYLIAITNPINQGVTSGKLSLTDQNITVNQTDIFKSVSTPNEFNVLRASGNVSLVNNKNRVATYNWNGAKYVRTTNIQNIALPADQADLIILDTGSVGNYTSGKDDNGNNNQRFLSALREKLVGTAKWDNEFGNVLLNKEAKLEKTQYIVTYGFKETTSTYNYTVNFTNTNP